MIYADLHMHTNYSDGLYEPEKVFMNAKEKGLGCIAICDHDTFFQQEIISYLSHKFHIKSIPGIEMSCYNYKAMKKVHIVGLFLNKEAPHVTELCNRTLLARDNYHKKLIKKFNEIGYNITYEDAKKFSPHNIVFKMNIFSTLKEKYPEIDDDFYKKYFQSKVPYTDELQMGYIDVKSGIDAINKDGGVAILAHPNLYDSFPEIDEYVGYGLGGIEIDHHSMSDEDRKSAIRIADKYGLLKSGGSDYHKTRFTKSGIEHLGNFGLTKEQFDMFITKCINGGIINDF